VSYERSLSAELRGPARVKCASENLKVRMQVVEIMQKVLEVVSHNVKQSIQRVVLDCRRSSSGPRHGP